VWNPWIDKARAMADFGDDEWNEMVCVETANAMADAVTIAPGEAHAMSATIEAR
jgi:D-hexose-6-phosphate mutarotase